MAQRRILLIGKKDSGKTSLRQVCFHESVQTEDPPLLFKAKQIDQDEVYIYEQGIDSDSSMLRSIEMHAVIFCIDAAAENYVAEYEELDRRFGPFQQPVFIALTKVDNCRSYNEQTEKNKKLEALNRAYPNIYETSATEGNRETVQALFGATLQAIQKAGLNPFDTDESASQASRSRFFTCPTITGTVLGGGLGLLAVAGGIAALVLLAGVTMPANLAIGIAILCAGATAAVIAGAVLGGGIAKAGEKIVDRIRTRQRGFEHI